VLIYSNDRCSLISDSHYRLGCSEYLDAIRYDNLNRTYQVNYSDITPTISNYYDQAVVSACACKFEHYLDALRIVVIDHYVDIRYQGAWWWKHILKAVPPLSEINELWDGMFDWLDDYEQGWVFEKLYPIDPLPPLANPLQSTPGSTFEAETPDAS
jgi:hypothetical protein